MFSIIRRFDNTAFAIFKVNALKMAVAVFAETISNSQRWPFYQKIP
jgi:hypothetical protein